MYAYRTISCLYGFKHVIKPQLLRQLRTSSKITLYIPSPALLNVNHLAQRQPVVMCTIRNYLSDKKEEETQLQYQYRKYTQKNQIPEEQKKQIEEILQPPTLQTRVKSLGLKTLDLTKNLIIKLPSWIWSLFVGTLKYSWMFIKRPSIVKDWTRDGWASIKKATHHYWIGFKLLGADIKYSAKLVWQVMQGKSLTRRQKQQLTQTVSDIFRLFPLMIFIVVPLMEFLLPVALMLFPNMLPSQFQDALAEKEKKKREVKARLAIAKFLQDTMVLVAKDLEKHRSKETVATAEELRKFIEDVREGKKVNNEDILKFAKLFSDEITLDNISRPQLVAMCKYMGLSSYGSDAMLRYRLRNRIRQIQADDKLIHWEGVNSLSHEELIYACHYRGMKIGVPKEELRQQLSNWIQLSLNQKIPPSLLILSRAFQYDASDEESLKTTLASLPDQVVSQAKAQKEEVEVNQQKLESLRRQEQLIKEEMETEEKMKKKEEQEPDLEKVAESKLQDVAEAISVLASDSAVSLEKEELTELKSALQDIQPTDPDVQALANKLKNIVNKLEKRIEQVDKEIGVQLNLLDLDKDGVITREELVNFLESSNILKSGDQTVPDELIEKVIKKIDRDGDGAITVRDLLNELREKRQQIKHQSVSDNK